MKFMIQYEKNIKNNIISKMFTIMSVGRNSGMKRVGSTTEKEEEYQSEGKVKLANIQTKIQYIYMHTLRELN